MPSNDPKCKYDLSAATINNLTSKILRQAIILLY